MLRLIKVAGVFFIAAMSLLAQYDNLFNSARAALRDKRFDEASTLAMRAIQLDKSRWEGYYVQATALVGLQQPSEALKYFRTALNLAPDSAKSDINRAIEACRSMVQATSTRTSPVPPAPDYHSVVKSWDSDGRISFPDRCVVTFKTWRQYPTLMTVAMKDVDNVTVNHTIIVNEDGTKRWDENLWVIKFHMQPGSFAIRDERTDLHAPTNINEPYYYVYGATGGPEMANSLIGLTRQCGGSAQ
jgi:tetratricopeptide (TPR) repeat protein